MFVGELRVLKGVDVLIDALALLAREGGRVTATIVGDGPDAARSQRAGRGSSGSSTLCVSSAPMPARTASRSAACWWCRRARNRCPTSCSKPPPPRVPMIATNVGGIPEIFGPQPARLVAPGDAAALARAIGAALADPARPRNEALAPARARAGGVLGRRDDRAVLAAYREALARQAAARIKN